MIRYLLLPLLAAAGIGATVETFVSDSMPHTSAAEGGRIGSGDLRECLSTEGEAAGSAFVLIQVSPPDTDRLLHVIRGSEFLGKIVNALVESGDVCRVRGHKWGVLIAPDNGIVTFTLEYRDPSVETRSCTVCGRTEYRGRTEWK